MNQLVSAVFERIVRIDLEELFQTFSACHQDPDIFASAHQFFSSIFGQYAAKKLAREPKVRGSVGSSEVK